ncbi:Ankyrin repeat protein [Legionella busanensis]|uniref:Ankyrin repeat protein n=1 Tax=Legionella busanensis TaxID=190655 RepID=A0A378JM99_9GAMM|nr:ankyrin repeat domain-containing protein [Legionella busanensis]STX51319.1 Ankyrin repeat protein [Legionella busanensis]
MLSSKLLDLLNNINQPNEILSKLREENFTVTELTDEGDSVLHVLAKSKHVKNINFQDYVQTLVKAGAPLNTVDNEGMSFLSCYLKHNDFYTSQVLDFLFEDEHFDINQPLGGDLTLFELILNSSFFQHQESLQKLIKHKDFNPNQKTSKYNSILLHMLSENSYSYREYVPHIVKNAKTNPNIKNSKGQTALAQLLSNDEYTDKALINAFINHEQFNVHSLDDDGNNYLQLAILHCKYSAEEIAKSFIEKGINVLYKNKDGKSVIDLINENKAGRSEYANKILLLEVLKLHPPLFFEKSLNGKTILSELLKSSDYSIISEFKNILEICKNKKEYNSLLKKIISDCFNEFRQKRVTESTILPLIKALVEANIDIDLEYCLACAALKEHSYERDEIYTKLKELNPKFDLSLATKHIKDLTQENSKEQLQAINYLNESLFDLNCFDEAMLAWEEKCLQSKNTPDIGRDCKMFGHLFSLGGSIATNSANSIKLTGSNYSDTAPFIVHLMNAYVKDCEQNGKHADHLESIKQVRNMTIKAMRFYFLSSSWNNYYPSLNSSKASLLSSVLTDSKNLGAEIITGWPEHAIDIIIQQDDFYRNNGGGCSTDATTEHYKISKHENLNEAVLDKLFNKSNYESNKSYIQHELHEILGLTFANTIAGKFQTVGNCSLASMLIALKVKYRLFLPEDIADELYTDTISFFEQFYLAEFISRNANHPFLPHLFMRLIIQKLIPEEKAQAVKELIKNHFNSEANQEIMQAEFMLHQWKLRTKGDSTEKFDKQIQALGIILNPNMSHRLIILNHFLNDNVTAEDLNELSSWLFEKQIFQGYPLLHFAVKNNNLELASKLIKLFPQAVNQTNWFDQEALCLVKSVEMIDLLIKAGASTSRIDYDNPLDYAIKANKVDLVEALLKHKAKPSEYSAYYAGSKDPKILQLLMDVYPEIINKPTHNYSTAIHAAARSGNNENISNLVYYGGVSPDACDVNGTTPSVLALQYEHPKTVILLSQYPGTLFKSPYRGDSLVSMTKDESLRKMLEKKKQERAEDLSYFEKFKASNPGVIREDIDNLIVAIRLNDVHAIRGCLIAYPNIKVTNCSNLYCTTPLTDAIRNIAGKKGKEYEEAFEIVKMLLKTPSININATMGSTEPILFMATSIGDVAVLNLFLADPKLDINKQDNVGYTALHDAVERGHLACVKRLLQDKRIDTTIVNHANETVLDLQSSNYQTTECQQEVIKYQQQHIMQEEYSSAKFR